MSLSLAIAANVLADLAIVGVLGFVMSRARLLTPHLSASGLAGETTASQPRAPKSLRSSRRADVPTRPSGLAVRA